MVMVPPGQQAIVNYPGAPAIMNLSKTSPITRKMQLFVPVFASSLELTQAAKDKKFGIEATPLATTTAASWRQKGIFLYDPLQKITPTNEVGPFEVAYELKGKFKSFFSGKPIPASGPASPPKENDPPPDPKGKQSPSSARLVVIGDSDFIKDKVMEIPAQYFLLGKFKNNVFLFQNLVDYLLEDESLIAIRAKTQTSRPLAQAEDSNHHVDQVWKYYWDSNRFYYFWSSALAF